VWFFQDAVILEILQSADDSGHPVILTASVIGCLGTSFSVFTCGWPLDFTLLNALNACYFEEDNSFGRLTLLAARLLTPQ
jgi:hypothetical protein